MQTGVILPQNLVGTSAYRNLAQETPPELSHLRWMIDHTTPHSFNLDGQKAL
jgi:hypothetical protein